MYEVSLWPILAAGLANVIIGFVWYHPKVFGSAWMRMANVSPEQVEAGKKMMPVMAFFGFLASTLMAYVAAHFSIAWGVYDWIGAVELAFWLWVGFIVPSLLGTVLWEGKKFSLYAINVGYWFVAMIVMSLILIW